MGKSGEMFLELQESQRLDEDYFIWLSEQEYEDYIISKYGNGLAGRSMLRTGESKEDDNQEI